MDGYHRNKHLLFETNIELIKIPLNEDIVPKGPRHTTLTTNY